MLKEAVYQILIIATFFYHSTILPSSLLHNSHYVSYIGYCANYLSENALLNKNTSDLVSSLYIEIIYGKLTIYKRNSNNIVYKKHNSYTLLLLHINPLPTILVDDKIKLEFVGTENTLKEDSLKEGTLKEGTLKEGSLLMKDEIMNCCKCKHFFVTWDKNFPRGCRLFGFKSRNLPSLTVQQATGKSCINFVARVKNNL